MTDVSFARPMSMPPANIASQMPAGMVFCGLLPEYENYIQILAKLREHHNVSYAKFAEAASLQLGFVSGAFGPSRTRYFGRISMFLLPPVVGLRLAFVYDPKLAMRYADELEPRHANQARPNNYARQPSTRAMTRVFKHIGTNGAAKLNRTMTKKQRADRARHAANARWFRVRKRQKLRATRGAM